MNRKQKKERLKVINAENDRAKERVAKRKAEDQRRLDLHIELHARKLRRDRIQAKWDGRHERLRRAALDRPKMAMDECW